MKPKETLATLDMEIRACQTELHALCGLRDAFLQLEKAIRRNGTGPIAPPETPKPTHHMQTPEAREKQRRAMKAYWRRKRAGRV